MPPPPRNLDGHEPHTWPCRRARELTCYHLHHWHWVPCFSALRAHAAASWRELPSAPLGLPRVCSMPALPPASAETARSCTRWSCHRFTQCLSSEHLPSCWLQAFLEWRPLPAGGRTPLAASTRGESCKSDSADGLVVMGRTAANRACTGCFTQPGVWRTQRPAGSVQQLLFSCCCLRCRRCCGTTCWPTSTTPAM